MNRKSIVTIAGTLCVLGTVHGAWENVRVNTTTGEVRPGGIGGITWNGADVISPPSNSITLRFHVAPDAPYGSGTLHVYAYRNASFSGYATLKKTVTVTDLRAQPYYSLILTNGTRFASNTYWYAWLDANGDGELNKLGVGGEWGIETMAEPAAVGEHMPLIVSDVNAATAVDFWMVGKKGSTPRHWWSEDVATNALVTMKNLAVGGLPFRYQVATFGRTALIEPDYLRYSGDAGCIGGWGWDDEAQATFQVLTGTATIKGTFTSQAGAGNPANANNVNPPTAYYPAGGQTVAAERVEFKLTDAWTDYSAVAIQVNHAATNGTRWYTFNGYMENEHYDDGTTRHMAPVGSFNAGSSYWWRARCVFGITNSARYKPTAWSSWANFVYTNAP
jgi:hypothetical protein